MPNLLILVPFRPQHLEAARAALGEGWTIEVHEPTNQENATAICCGKYSLQGEALLDALMRADAVIGEPDPAVLRAAVDAGSPVKLVQMTWAGADKYTRSKVAWPAGVALANAVGGFGQLISQYAVAQALGMMQNLPGYRDAQKDAAWTDLGAVESMDDANVLIFGAGNISACIAKRLAGFTCTITGVCRNTAQPREGFDRLVTLEDAEAELATADAMFCALPNSAQTAGWLDARRLGLMKPNAVIVNVGRGTFIDGYALADALAASQIRGAALDVTNPEPLPADHPLWREPRCSITPHISGGSFGRHIQTENNIVAICCRNLAALVAGDPLENRVPLSAFEVAPV